VSFRNENVSFRVGTVVPAIKARETLTGSVTLQLPPAFDDGTLAELKRALGAHPGPVPVFLEVPTAEGRRVILRAPNECLISPSEGFLADIEGVLGAGRVKFSGRPSR
jgi:hypothetical protein